MSKCLFRLGEDSEAFLVDQDGNVKSAIPYFKAGKGKAEPLPCGYGGAIHDNALVETNTNPASSRAEWLRNNLAIMEDVRTKAASHGLRVLLAGSLMVPPLELLHIDARTFGCEPDFNAWTLAPNDVPTPTIVGNRRSAGGHIHMGTGNSNRTLNYNLKDMMGKARIVRLADMIVGLPLVVLDTLEGNRERRTFYGSAGSFRPKPYGVECRSFSPYWKTNEATMGLVWDLFGRVAEIASTAKDDKLQQVVDELTIRCGGEDSIRSAIDESDEQQAFLIMEESKDLWGDRLAETVFDLTAS